jgi:hypothetical protein
MTNKEKPDATGEWKQTYQAFFQGNSSSWNVKFEIEKTTGILLTRDQEQNSKLVFKGTSLPPPAGHRLELRLEAVLPDHAWYLLYDEMWLPRSWSSEAEFRRDADRDLSIPDAQSANRQPGVLRYGVAGTLRPRDARDAGARG